ncbi:MAG: AarF/ABC1/UbiB kinase family protein, partial [Deltaproteobacteria bacterium]|nr:AarF/ABC1/UbiB kinase family protein [Deltaproteobacteria bacterium]
MLSIRQIGVIGRTYRHLNRYRQILSVFFKFGFGDLIERLSIDAYLEIGMQMISRKRRDRVEKLTRAQRLRMAIEELGPTYVKLGQILSTRPDLIPAEFIAELSKLQDEVPPHPFEEIRSIIESELQNPIDDLFSQFDAQPIASASIGQVHKGRLLTGEAVAIKVQRPGIEKVVEVDLEIMLHLATLMERHVAEMALLRPINIVEEFARTIEKEMDYGIESANMRRFSLLFAEDSTTYVPKVYSDYSTRQVLTMEFVSGIKISHIEQLDAAGLDKKIITARGADLILRQVFVHGFFHADPHPGNLFVLPDHVICLLDFGMVGMVDRDTRERFVELMDAVVNRDASMTTRILLQLTNWDESPDVRALERD